jgi:predicted RNA-binding protein with PIN domain
MSRQFLVDGYNVMKKLPALAALADRSLEEGRAGLARLIRERRPHGRGQNSITVVYDGQEGISPSIGPDDISTDVRVIFTRGGSADDHIRRCVEDAADPRVIICVTDDRELAFACRHRGAQIWSVAEFAAQVYKADRPAHRAGPGESDGKALAQTAANRIDREFSALWLRKKD